VAFLNIVQFSVAAEFWSITYTFLIYAQKSSSLVMFKGYVKGRAGGAVVKRTVLLGSVGAKSRVIIEQEAGGVA